MRSPRSVIVKGGDKGTFLVRVKVNGQWRYITTFRGAPTKIQTITSSDPFGPASAEIELPAVTSFDKLGEHDLDWLKEWAAVDLVWSGDELWVWEGFIASIEVGDTVRVQLKGALHILDNYLAAPFYPSTPVPYEALIKRACAPPDSRTGLGAFTMAYPNGWGVTAPTGAAIPMWQLRPRGIAAGQKWTGLATRSTGSWEPYLTGHVQTLLSTMYTPEGDQWTLMMNRHRRPYLFVRNQVNSWQSNTLHVTNATPGVKVSLSRDWSQSANVIYGAGSDAAGVGFSNMSIGIKNDETYYEPFAFNRAVHPNNANKNSFHNPSVVRKETRLDFTPGLSEAGARGVAQSHLQKFADPGWVGNITLTADPLDDNNKPINRFLMLAGGTIVVHGWGGANVFLHITQTVVSPEDGTVSLSVDSKYRDALTAHEVYARTRDALNPVNQLQAGRLSIVINDLVKPWSYQGGSGFLPSTSTKIFESAADTDKFPWLNLTAKFPPKTHPSLYVKVSGKRKAEYRRNVCWQQTHPTSVNDFGKLKNWGVDAKFNPVWATAVPLIMSQVGQIRLSQVAAYDKDGKLLPVEFHVSIYSNTVTSSAMPRTDNDKTKRRKPGNKIDPYPFFAGAFDQMKPNGELKSESATQVSQDADMRVGWGTYAEPAGYSPGLFSLGAKKTGMLSDETTWDYDTVSDKGFDQQSIEKTKASGAGKLYAMIYCDDKFDTTEDVYFLGRFWVARPGG